MRKLIEILDVNQGLDVIGKANPELYRLLAPAKLNKALKLVKLNYRYGDTILDQGNLKLPVDSHITVSEQLNIDYCSIPLCLVLNKSCEVFLGNRERIMPLNLINAGNFFGIFEVLSWYVGQPENALWNISAGSRSAFILPSIGDKISHKKLQERYNFFEDAPKSILEQLAVFSKINGASSHPWDMDIIIFTKGWFFDENIRENLFSLLFTLGWRKSQGMRDQAVLDYLNEIFGYIMKKRKIIIPPLILDKIRQLIMLGDRILPGFAPAVDNSTLPLDIIQKAYINCYQLKNYSPIVVQPQFLMENVPVYYFLNYPYFSNFYKGPVKSFLTELKFIQKNLNLLLEEFKKSSDAKIFHHLGQVRYQFFHSEAIESENILSPNLIEQQDQNWCNVSPNHAFPVNASAFNGCIKISLK